MTQAQTNNSISTQNIFRKRKQFMRLCAIAMVEDCAIKPSEKVVLDVIYADIFSGLNDSDVMTELKARFADVDGSSPALLYGALLTSDESMRRSMFMNIEAMSLDEVAAELKYIIKVVNADNSVTDREREAFRVVCKLFKIKGSYKLWNELYNISPEDLAQKQLVLKRKSSVQINDFKTIRKALEFYNIQGPIVDGVYHVLQRELTHEREDVYRSDKKWYRISLWSFAITALVIYTLVTFFKVEHGTAASLLVSVSIPIMMISIEWLIFMLEEYAFKHEDNAENHRHGNSVLVVLVAAAIIADVCIGLIELGGHLTVGTVTGKVASALLLGCICFFIGKFIDMHRVQKSIDIKEMKKVVENIEQRIQNQKND